MRAKGRLRSTSMFRHRWCVGRASKGRSGAQQGYGLAARGRTPRASVKLLRGLLMLVSHLLFSTAVGDVRTAGMVAEAADLCLLPARPTCLDVDATATTFRSLFLAKCSVAFVLNQCPPTDRSTRAAQAASALERLGLLAPMVASRIDFQDAMAAGLGVTEHASKGDRHRKSRRSGAGYATALHGARRGARRYSRTLVAPEVFEPRRRQFGASHRVLNVFAREAAAAILQQSPLFWCRPIAP